MEQSQIKSILESLLFATERPLTVKEMQAVFGEELGVGLIHEALESLKKDYEEQGRAFRLCEIAGGFQIRTEPFYAEWIAKLEQKKPTRLSMPALETLAIIAYRQPVTRSEIDDIRGVDSGGVLKGLVDRKLVKILGKKDEPGCPMIYGTTPEFLGLFGIQKLADLPSLKEFEEKMNEGVESEKVTRPEESFDNLFEDVSDTVFKMGELDEEARETFDLLDAGLKHLKEVEKGLGIDEEQELDKPSADKPELDKPVEETINTASK